MCEVQTWLRNFQRIEEQDENADGDGLVKEEPAAVPGDVGEFDEDQSAVQEINSKVRTLFENSQRNKRTIHQLETEIELRDAEIERLNLMLSESRRSAKRAKTNLLQTVDTEGGKHQLDAANNALTSVMELHKSGVSLEGIGEKRRSDLILQISEAGNLRSVEILIDRGFDVNSEYTSTPLIKAAQIGNPELVELLISHGADVSKSDYSDTTPLLAAASRGHVEVVKFLVSKGALSTLEKDRKAALLSASKHGHLGVVEHLLDCGVDVANPEKAHKTVSPENLGMVSFWSDGTNVIVASGTCPLCAAALRGHEDVVKSLVRKGAASRLRWCSGNLLVGLVGMRSTKMIRTLIEGGVDASSKTDSGYTALMAASRVGDIYLVQYLIRCGARINDVDFLGRSALWMAADAGQYRACKFLLANGANVKICDEEGGLTPLHAAASP